MIAMLDRTFAIHIACDQVRWVPVGEFGTGLRTKLEQAIAQAQSLRLPVYLDLSEVSAIGTGACQLLLKAIESLPHGAFHLIHCPPLFARQLGLTGHTTAITAEMTHRIPHADQQQLRKAWLKRTHVQLARESDGARFGHGWLLEVNAGALLFHFSEKILAGRAVYHLTIDGLDTTWPLRIRHVARHSDAWRIGAEFVQAQAGRELLDELGQQLFCDSPPPLPTIEPVELPSEPVKSSRIIPFVMPTKISSSR
ncbi:hypothetical protein GCM10027182_11720 [Aquaspirillum soli]